MNIILCYIMKIYMLTLTEKISIWNTCILANFKRSAMCTNAFSQMERKVNSGCGSSPAPVAAMSLPVTVSSPFLAVEAPNASSFLGVTDEYDPRRPNDYESYVKMRKEQKMKEREEERKKDLEEREKLVLCCITICACVFQ